MPWRRAVPKFEPIQAARFPEDWDGDMPGEVVSEGYADKGHLLVHPTGQSYGYCIPPGSVVLLDAELGIVRGWKGSSSFHNKYDWLD